MSDSMTMTAPTDQTVDPTPAETRQDDAPARNGARKKRSATGAKPGRGRKGLTPADVRAVLRKHQDLTEATDEQRTMLAAALGKPGADVDQLTEIILTSARVDMGAISDLTEIGEREGAVKRAIAAMQLTADRARAKAVWHLLVTLDVVTGNAPGNDGDLAEGTATAIDDITDEHAAQLDAVRFLASR